MKIIQNWLQWPAQPWYSTCEWVWLSLFLTGFCILPNEWPQRFLFYAAIPLTFPLVWRAKHLLVHNSAGLCILAFLLWSTLSLIWSGNAMHLPDYGRKVCCILYFLLICLGFGQQGIQAWRTLMVQHCIIASVVAVILITYLQSPATLEQCLFGLGAHANANYTADVFGFFALVGFAATLDTQSKRFTGALLCQMPILYLLLLTGSRAALCSYISGLSLCLFIQFFRARQNVLSYVLILGGLLVTFAVFLVLFNPHWLKDELARGDTHRLLIWRTNLEYIHAHPWRGYGATTVEQISVNGNIIGRHAHNVLLAQWFYSGIIGAIVWAGVMGTLAYQAYQVWRKTGQLTPAMGLWFFTGISMVDVGWLVVEPQALWVYTWLMAGLVMSYYTMVFGPAPYRQSHIDKPAQSAPK